MRRTVLHDLISFNHHEFLKSACEAFAPAGPGHHAIFDARADRAILENRRLDREYHAFFDQGRVALGQERRFVHVPADGMSKAVAEGVAISRIVQNIASVPTT